MSDWKRTMSNQREAANILVFGFSSGLPCVSTAAKNKVLKSPVQAIYKRCCTREGGSTGRTEDEEINNANICHGRDYETFYVAVLPKLYYDRGHTSSIRNTREPD